MLDRPFRLELGPYWVLLPENAVVSAEVKTPAPGDYQMAATHWTIIIGRYRIFARLDPLNDLGHLKAFIDQTTKGDVVTPPVTINGVPGVTHGGYGPLRTWIDWWFKKGDTMICLCLQSLEFPVAFPTSDEMHQHGAIIGSLKFCRDFPNEKPPVG